MGSTTKGQQLDYVRSLLSSEEVFEPGSKEYKIQSAPWSTWADQHPSLVLQPTTLDRISTVVKALYDSNLDFAVRNTGTGSVSAKDAILSTHGFKSFAFSPEDETVTIGSGFDWGEVDKLMDEQAHGWQVVGARCSWVGVAGSTLVGGLSWLSHEFGMISDPQNLLDMQVVLRDGRIVWAAADGEEDLMWALRGGGGNFGVVTALKLRARRYPTKVFCGMIFYPYTSLPYISKALYELHKRPTDPKIAAHIVTRGAGMGESPGDAHPGIAIMMFDGHGETHARSDAGFAFAWQIPDAIQIQAGEISTRQLNAVAETFRDWQGTNVFWLCAPLLSNAAMDEETLVRAWKWWEKAYAAHPGFNEGSTVLFEFMQAGASSGSGARSATAFPRHERRHVMQLVLGCKPDTAPANIKEVVMKLFEEAGPMIAGGKEKETGEYHAGFLHEWNDLRHVFGENFDRLRAVKKRFDPENRFNKGTDLVKGFPGEGTTV